MENLREAIYCDSHHKHLRLSIESPGDWFWVEQFIEHCNSAGMADRAIYELQGAMERHEAWKAHYNAVVAAYDPDSQSVTAAFELSDVEIHPASTIQSDEFIRLLRVW